MERNISDLPQEVLSHIFSFLNLQHRLAAGLVCKSWLQVCDSPQFLEKAWVVVNTKEVIQGLLVTTRKFTNLRMRRTEVSNELIGLFTQLGSQLLHLDFHDCWAANFLYTRAECPNLISLKVEGDADFLLNFSSLKRLRRLDLRHTFTLSDLIFSPLHDVVGLDLEAFSISNEVVWDSRVCKRFQLKGSGSEGKSDAILSCCTVESFIEKRAKSLTDLEFPEWISGEAAVRVTKITGLSLRNITFRSCQQCSKDVLPEICRNQPSLVSIDVSRLAFLSDKDVARICQLLPNLQRFIARECLHLDTCIPFLFELKHLREVDLSGCSGITPASFTAAVDTFQSRELQVLRLGRTNVEEVHIENLVSRLPQLKRLDLDFCKGISNKLNIGTLFMQLPKLQELSICVSLGEVDEEPFETPDSESWVGWPRFKLITRNSVVKEAELIASCS